jgi:hypothetical protein
MSSRYYHIINHFPCERIKRISNHSIFQLIFFFSFFLFFRWRSTWFKPESEQVERKRNKKKFFLLKIESLRCWQTSHCPFFHRVPEGPPGVLLAVQLNESEIFFFNTFIRIRLNFSSIKIFSSALLLLLLLL